MPLLVAASSGRLRSSIPSPASGRYVELRAQRPPHLARLCPVLDRPRCRTASERTQHMVGNQHVTARLSELTMDQLPELRQPHAPHRRCRRSRGRYGGVVKSTELPGISPTVWSVVMLTILLSALAGLIYRLYTHRKR